MEYILTPEYIMMIHDDNIKMYGGEYGVREQGTFEMLCEASYQTMFGTDLYPTIFDKAAKLVEGFATHQVFYDGNKRTGLSAMNALLKANCYELTLTNMEAYQFVLDIANHKYEDLQQIADILQHSVRKTEKSYEIAQKEIIKNLKQEERIYMNSTQNQLSKEALTKIAQEIDVQYGPAMRMLAAGEESAVKEIENECVSEEEREQ